jgi:primosomal protein N' (replication factor Y)
VRALVREDAARDPAAAAARIPHTAWRAAQAGLAEGPVLIQVARRGYVPVAACQACREIARCSCGGPIAVGERSSHCSWCGTPVAQWACPHCGGRRLRAVAVGADRTVEEVGRAFPGVPVLASHAGRMVAEVGERPAVVVATPGAEPSAQGGYRAVLLLDARAMLDRPRLDAQEDAMRRWFGAARLAAPRAPVVIVAPNEARPVQALVRWDAPWCAELDLQERVSAGFPPATRIAALTGARSDLMALAAAVDVPHEALGPVTVDGVDRLLLRVARRDGAALAVRLRALTATRSAARSGVVHVRMDPGDL